MQRSMELPIKVLDHHVHLSPEHAAQLLGGNEIAPTDSQKISVIGPGGTVHNVRVAQSLGPFTQLELSHVAALHMGITVPLRHSGDLAGSPGAILVGPQSTVEIEQGLIIPNNHVHLSLEDASRISLSTGDHVDILVQGLKKIEYKDVLVRVEDAKSSMLHLGSDEANAAILNLVSQAVLNVNNVACLHTNEGEEVRIPGFEDIQICLVNRANSPLAVEAVNFCTNIFEFSPAEKRRMTANLLDVQRGARDNYFFLVAYDENGVVGVTSTYYLPDIEMAFMEFIAVSTQRQRKGLGSFLCYQTTEMLKSADKKLGAMVFEVRSTKDGLARRKEFFLNLGAFPINLQFYPIGHKMDPDLMLMIKPMSTEFCFNTSILVKFFSSLAKALMTY